MERCIIVLVFDDALFFCIFILILILSVAWRAIRTFISIAILYIIQRYCCLVWNVRYKWSDLILYVLAAYLQRTIKYLGTNTHLFIFKQIEIKYLVLLWTVIALRVLFELFRPDRTNQVLLRVMSNQISRVTIILIQMDLNNLLFFEKLSL
jgi:hypothetical protein